jgi:hypothetical protein
MAQVRLVVVSVFGFDKHLPDHAFFYTERQEFFFDSLTAAKTNFPRIKTKLLNDNFPNLINAYPIYETIPD